MFEQMLEMAEGEHSAPALRFRVRRQLGARAAVSRCRRRPHAGDGTGADRRSETSSGAQLPRRRSGASATARPHHAPEPRADRLRRRLWWLTSSRPWPEPKRDAARRQTPQTPSQGHRRSWPPPPPAPPSPCHRSMRLYGALRAPPPSRPEGVGAGERNSLLPPPCAAALQRSRVSFSHRAPVR